MLDRWLARDKKKDPTNELLRESVTIAVRWIEEGSVEDLRDARAARFFISSGRAAWPSRASSKRNPRLPGPGRARAVGLARRSRGDCRRRAPRLIRPGAGSKRQGRWRRSPSEIAHFHRWIESVQTLLLSPGCELAGAKGFTRIGVMGGEIALPTAHAPRRVTWARADRRPTKADGSGGESSSRPSSRGLRDSEAASAPLRYANSSGAEATRLTRETTGHAAHAT